VVLLATQAFGELSIMKNKVILVLSIFLLTAVSTSAHAGVPRGPTPFARCLVRLFGEPGANWYARNRIRAAHGSKVEVEKWTSALDYIKNTGEPFEEYKPYAQFVFFNERLSTIFVPYWEKYNEAQCSALRVDAAKQGLKDLGKAESVSVSVSEGKITDTNLKKYFYQFVPESGSDSETNEQRSVSADSKQAK